VIARTIPIATLVATTAVILTAASTLPMAVATDGGVTGAATEPVTRDLVPEGGVVAYSLAAPTSVSPSGIVARAIVPAGLSCPAVQVTNQGKTSSVPMAVRSPGATTGTAFTAVTVCSAALPKGARSATILGTSIPAAMPKAAQTIAYLADTGCRIKKTVQNCASPQGWPLGLNASLIAQRDADLIVHGGDYIYRETACPASSAAKCGGSPEPTKGEPFIDNAALWFADFFDPVAPMLSTAPIVAARGNHEACDTAGNGFFLFMDPRPSTAGSCAPKGKSVPVVQSPSWATDVSLGGGRSVRLVVVDSANGWDSVPSPFLPKQRASYQQAANLAKGASDAWLVVHRPLFGITSEVYSTRGDHYWVPWISADQAAAGSGLLGSYSLIVSGHEHLSQAVQVPGQPPQFVAGAGGTALNPKSGYSTPKYGPLTFADGSPMSSDIKPYRPASFVSTDVDFAVILASPGSSAGRWNMVYTTPTDSILKSCAVASDKVTC
jgi:hypothetical protein